MPNQFERVPNSIPTPEEVLSVFREFIGNHEYKEVRKREDEQGLYLWDVVVHTEEGKVEYSYMRFGQYVEGRATETAIYVVFYDTDGVPCGGNSIAKYIGGQWLRTP